MRTDLKLAIAVAATLALAVPAQTGANTAGLGASLSAAKKKHRARHPRAVEPEGQIACTVAGCHRIPANCHPTMGYTWDGIPSGFDVVICRRRR